MPNSADAALRGGELGASTGWIRRRLLRQVRVSCGYSSVTA